MGVLSVEGPHRLMILISSKHWHILLHMSCLYAYNVCDIHKGEILICVGRGVCSFCKTTMNKGSSIFFKGEILCRFNIFNKIIDMDD